LLPYFSSKTVATVFKEKYSFAVQTGQLILENIILHRDARHTSVSKYGNLPPSSPPQKKILRLLWYSWF